MEKGGAVGLLHTRNLEKETAQYLKLPGLSLGGGAGGGKE